VADADNGSMTPQSAPPRPEAAILFAQRSRRHKGASTARSPGPFELAAE
jgi:hypothetical protein